MESIVTRLKGRGLDIGAQAALLGLTTKTLGRWEEANNIPPHPRAMLGAFETALINNPELAESVAQDIVSKGVVYALHNLLVAAHPI